MKPHRRLVVPLLLLLSTVFLFSLAAPHQVAAQPSTPTISSELLKAAISVCSGNALAQAGDYSRPKPVHPAIFLDTETGQPVAYVLGVDKWLAKSISDLEVVACVTHVETELEQCPLLGSRRVVRYDRTARVRVVIAQNASTTYRFELKAGTPPACSLAEFFAPEQYVKKSFGEMDGAQFVKSIQPYIGEAVQAGAASGTPVSGASITGGLAAGVNALAGTKVSAAGGVVPTITSVPKTSTPTASNLNSQVDEAAASVCNGKFVKEAAPFLAKPGLRPIVFIRNTTRLVIGPTNWYPKSTSEMLLVACIKDSQEQIQRCWYDKDHFINRKVNRVSVEVMEARTGSIIRTYTLRGSEPAPCYSTESFPSGTFERTKTGGVVATNDIIKAVTPLVQP